MKKVLVTGANGFIGKNLCIALKERKDITVYETDIDTPDVQLEDYLIQSEIVYHLAGVNRPKDPTEFETGNAGSIENLIALAAKHSHSPALVVTSSVQAALDNPYGQSKLHGEQLAASYEKNTGATVYVFRLANAFGKWSRPFYNSVIATFCHQAAHGEPFRIDDPDRVIDFVYIDDIVEALIGILDGKEPPIQNGYYCVKPVFPISIGSIAERLHRFVESRKTCILPNLADPFEKRLYSTYLSYLDTKDFEYQAEKKSDARGYLYELIKSPHAGQIFVSRTLQGITRGNHYHHTKIEKFCVIEGRALISFRHILTDEKTQLEVNGTDCKIVDIPPGWTHNIKNIGNSDLLTIFWANEMFDPNKPDTIFAGVDDEKN